MQSVEKVECKHRGTCVFSLASLGQEELSPNLKKLTGKITITIKITDSKGRKQMLQCKQLAKR